MVVNMASSDSTAELATNCRTVSVNANQIAIKHKLGSRLQPQVNIVILGAYAGASGEVTLSAIEDALAGQFGNRDSQVQQAVREAYEGASGSLP